MVLILKKAKSIWNINLGENFETSIVGPLVILVALVRRQIGQGYSNSGNLVGRPSINTLFPLSLSNGIETWQKYEWQSYAIVCFKIQYMVGITISLLWMGLASTTLICR